MRTRGRTQLIRPEAIDWIESIGNYAQLYVRSKTYLVRCTMEAIAAVLEEHNFVRIHRRIIVRLDAVSEIWRRANEEPHVVLEDGTRLPMQHSYYSKLIRVIRPWP